MSIMQINKRYTRQQARMKWFNLIGQKSQYEKTLIYHILSLITLLV